MQLLSPAVDVVFVYIAEAHADDEWPIGQRFANDPFKPVIRQHTQLAERLAAATKFMSDYKLDDIPVFMDSMDNAFDRAYASWPVRFYVIDADGALALKAQPRRGIYNFTAVVAFAAERYGLVRLADAAA